MKLNSSILKTAIVALGIMASVCGLYAQNSTMTPYSRYGYGMLNDNATSA